MLQHFIFTTFGKICYKGFEMSIESSNLVPSYDHEKYQLLRL